jgi:hypothetical protein
VLRLLKLLLVLALLALALDRGGDYVAEQAAGGELQRSQGLQREPDVSITGFPFLNQFASGRYDRVIVTAQDVRVGTSDTSLKIAKVRLDFRTVTASRNFMRFRAKTATAHATIGYAALSRTLGIKVRFGGDGLITASKKFTVLGETVRPTITVKPEVASDALTFAGSKIGGGQELPAQVSTALREAFGADLSLKNLPFDVQVKAVKVTRSGLDLTLTGSHLSYAPKR